MKTRDDSTSDRCRFSYDCTGCSSRNDLSALSVDPKGYLRPVRCKACGMAARPTMARCSTCRAPWQACVSRPAPGLSNAACYAHRVAQGWVLPFATDFSGMDMISFALDEVLLGASPPISVGILTSGTRLGDSALATIPRTPSFAM